MSLPEFLFIDLDGTITDPAPGIIGSYQHALRSIGLPVPAFETLHEVIGPPLRKSFPRFGVPEGQVEKALEHYRERYGGGAMFDATVYAGIPELLAEARQRGHRLHVVTAKPHVLARPIIAHFGLIDLFEHVHGPELDGTRDHKGDLIRHILTTHGMRADEAIMIGDRANDIIAANENGMASVGVLWGYGDRAELANSGAGRIIARPSELLA
jgi:phosphoglycolate phosphatase